MKNRTEDISMQVDERTELLINRYLDGRLDDVQQAELHAMLGRDAAARALFEMYGRNDALAAQALRRGVEGTMTATVRSRWRGSWLALASSGLAAAAVLVFSIAPRLQNPSLSLPGGGRNVVIHRPAPPLGLPDSVPYADPMRIPEVASRLVDYRDDDLMPQRRQQRTDRELIGIRGDDGRLYIIERQVDATRVAPMAGEY